MLLFINTDDTNSCHTIILTNDMFELISVVFFVWLTKTIKSHSSLFTKVFTEVCSVRYTHLGNYIPFTMS